MTQQQAQPQSTGLLSYFQVPDTYEFVSLQSAEGYIEILKFVHNNVVQIPNKERKIVADVQMVNDGEYYVVTLNWQTFPQNFATASAFVFDNPDRDGCEIRGYAELTTAIPLYGLILFIVAGVVHLVTGIGVIAFVLAFVGYILATRGAIRWRDALVQHFLYLAQIMPQPQQGTDHDEEFDERIDQLVMGIKKGA